MAKSQETYSKKEKEKKRLKKRQEKLEKREARKSQPKASFDDMIAYVDEYGNTTSTPPDPTLKKKEVKLEDIEISIPKRAKEELDTVRKGKVDFFNHDKGFGFIIQEETKESFFVHVNGCEDEITENDIVTFELEKGLKGMNAVKVKKV